MRLPWAEELERWLPFLSPKDVHLVFSFREDLEEGVPCPKVSSRNCVRLGWKASALSIENCTGGVLLSALTGLKSKRRDDTAMARAMFFVYNRL
jgi:hypothetical protein